MNKFLSCALLAAAATTWVMPSISWAASSPAEQAAEMMARAQAMDAKCNFLAAHERDKLSKFTARAELALANRESAADTKATMQRGRDAAQATACSPDEKATVEQILMAALQAAGENKPAAKLAAQSSAPAPAAQPEAKPALAQDTIPAAPAPEIAATKPVPAAPPVKVASAQPPDAKPQVTHLAKKQPAVAAAPKLSVSGLSAYENLTAAYFRARRCGGNQSATYQAVVAEHGRLMHSHSAAQVAAALHRGEARAASSSCS